MNREQGLAEIERTRLIAIVRGIAADRIVQVAEALCAGGITVMEVTWNTPGAADMIRTLRQQMDGRMFIGAGTVTDTDELRLALDAGASFIVMPNTDEHVIRGANDAGVPVYPGAMTPSEIVRAWKAGATAVKLFPSASLGIAYVKELQGPLSHIPMVAVGGIDASNIHDYLDIGCCALGIGSSVIHKADIEAGAYDRITARAKLLTDQVLAHA